MAYCKTSNWCLGGPLGKLHKHVLGFLSFSQAELLVLFRGVGIVDLRVLPCFAIVQENTSKEHLH